MNRIVKLCLIFAVLGGLFLGGWKIFSFSVQTLNHAVVLDENSKASWSSVENHYQRRYDLIPNLVETVKGYASHEKDVFVEVAEKRASVGKIQLTADDLTNPQKMAAFQKAQGELTGALSRLMVVSEKYPELKANANFTALQSQLEETENQILSARKEYIESIRQYNSYLRIIPQKWVLSMFGDFEKKAEYSIEEEVKKAPVVKFN